MAIAMQHRAISSMRGRTTRLAFALAVVLGATLVATQFAQAQAFSVLYSFTGTTDGANPWATLIRDGAGNLYGTTQAGGSNGVGTVFQLDASGTENVLYSFTAGTDGGLPLAGLVRDEAGNLYGTTFFGGVFACGCGTVFKLDPTGKETVLYSFTGYPVDGADPYAEVVRDRVGNLYGTTSSGGAYGDGIVFKLDTTGKETLLHTFTGGPDGGGPVGDLVLDGAGNLYGTTFYGGKGCGLGCGVVFKLTKAGKFTLLHTFTGTPDGQGPHAGLVRDAAGNLYGTTSNGGAHGWGTVFKLDKAGKETILYSFTGGADGGRTRGSGLIRDQAGNLYGTTFSGGGGSCPDHGYGAGCGVVFRVSKSGKETVLHQFTGADGAQPTAGLLRDAAGNLYGTTSRGGANSSGEVFKIAP
jgi:uncharacterized repeat protein (TIGR03803 family)